MLRGSGKVRNCSFFRIHISHRIDIVLICVTKVLPFISSGVLGVDIIDATNGLRYLVQDIGVHLKTYRILK